MKTIKSLKLQLAGLLLAAFCLLPSALFGQAVGLYVPNTTNALTSMQWGGVIVGAASSTQAVTLTNVGSATLSSITLSFTGTNTGDFGQVSVPATNCGGSLTAGSSCTITVTFTPQAIGARSATLNIADNATGSPQLITLGGVGVQGGPISGTPYAQFLSEFALPALNGSGTTLSCLGCSTTSTQGYGAGLITVGVTTTQIIAGTVTLSGGALNNCAPPAYSSCGFIYWPGSGSSLSFTTNFNVADAAGDVIVTLMTTNASNVPVAAYPYTGQTEITPQLFELSTASITPTATSAAVQTVGQTFTLTGIASGEFLSLINQPAPTSLCPTTGVRASGANQITLYFTVLTASACTPAAGVYTFLPIR